MNIIFLFIVILNCILLFGLGYYLVFDVELLKVLPQLLPILLLVALFTLLERKVLGSIQRRRGPNVVGLWGFLQPFSDAFKLIFKESIIPGLSNIILFIFAPIFTFTLSLLNWSVLPLSANTVLSDINLGLMFIFTISSLGVYGIIISGWSSNNRYAFLGALRAAAQFVSYEVSIGISLMTVILVVNSFNLSYIILSQEKIWYFLPFFPSLVLFFIAALAETNRVPFDLPEAESELVSGYNVEYSATTFVLFFLAEYANILLMSTIVVIFFFGGWFPIINIYIFYLIPGWIWFTLKILSVSFFFIIIRATLPRYRYDQLMYIGWKVLLPLALINFIFYSVIIWLFF